jgi:hypothetical protein
MNQKNHDNQEALLEGVARKAYVASLCPALDRFWEVALGGAWDEAERQHLAGCSRCRDREASIRKAAAAPPPVRILVLLADHRIRRFPVRDAAATDRGIVVLPEQPLRFPDDPDLLGRLYQEHDLSHWLELKHAHRGVGTLLRVVLDGAVRRFLLLREGDPAALGCLRVESLLPDDAPLTVEVEVIEAAADLAADEVDELKQSFHAAHRDDPAAVVHWRTWAARQAEGGGGLPEVTAALREIAGSRE